MLFADYYTKVPSAFGAENAAQLRLVPCTQNDHWLRWPTKTMYHDRIKERLSRESACFHLQALEYRNERETPVENAAHTWKGEWKNIAQLIFPVQNMTLDGNFCDQSTFNPWNQILEHQPLGGISRSRAVAYTMAQELRRKLAKLSPEEITWQEVIDATKTNQKQETKQTTKPKSEL